MSFEELEEHIKIANWIKEFREERLDKISESNGDQSAERPARIIMHLIPFKSLDPLKYIELKSAPLVLRNFELLPAKHNSDGLGCNFNYDSNLQLFRNGAIELAKVFSYQEISGSRLENDLITGLDKSLKIERSLGFEPPIFVIISLIDASGYKLFQEMRGFHDAHGSEIMINRLDINPLTIENYDIEAASVLRPAMDAIWQALGKTGSPYYNEDGSRRDTV